MTTENIIEVGIDDKERIYIKPEKQNFEFIWRDASGIRWDETKGILYTPKKGEWTFYNWYQQIIMATRNEYGCQLVLTDKTQWANIPSEVKREITQAPTTDQFI